MLRGAWIALIALSFLLGSALPLGSGKAHGDGAQRARDVAAARQLFEQGVAAYDRGDFDVALERLSRAYRLTGTPELAFNVARVYERMGECDPAIRHFREFLRRGKPTPEQRADVDQRIAALVELKARQKSQVFTAPPSKDELTREAETFFRRGVAMYRRKNYRAAMEAFVAASRFADLPEIHFNLAVTAEKLGDRSASRLHYRDYQRTLPRTSPEWHRIQRTIDALRER